MGMYHRARHAALTAACLGGLVAGLASLTPASAFAACKTPITGSGSTLQTKQQEKWAAAWKTAGSPECGKEVTVEYNKPSGTGSGQGLEEWGMPGKSLVATKSSNGTSLDAFVGTDDPPNGTLLTEGKEASGSFVLTTPVVAAPVAAIVHLPANAGSCTYTAPAKLEVTQAQLKEVWLGGSMTWATLLGKWGFTGITGCTATVKHKVRSDSSGTSFAFKFFLCQIEGGSSACTEWNKGKILTDAVEWPAATKAETEYENASKEKVADKGNPGEAAAVAETEGSVGYENYQNARTEPSGKAFTAYSSTAPRFWLKLEDQSGKFAEPGKGTGGKEGNCPTELTAEQESELPTVKGGENTANWEKFHLSGTTVKTSGTYADCTLTYDELWENYETATLEGAGAYGSAAKAQETREAGANYFKWILLSTGGQANIEEGYSEVPAKVKTKATEAVNLVK